MKNIKDLKITSVVACYKDEQSIPVMHKRLTDVFKKIGTEFKLILLIIISNLDFFSTLTINFWLKKLLFLSPLKILYTTSGFLKL